MLETYRHKFAHLNRNRQHGGAPHKPVLLLALIDLYERGLILRNRIKFSDLLVATFRSVWDDLVGDHEHFNPTVIYPMYHMKSEGFWHLQAKSGAKLTGNDKKDLRSFAHFQATLDEVEIDPQLHQLLLEPVSRMTLQAELLGTYFADQQAAYLQEAWENRQDRLQQWTLQDGITDVEMEPSPPKKREARLKWEEEKFIRKQKFPLNIRKLYQDTCCVTQLRIAARKGSSMVDACHIIPWEKTHDDHVQNGIALTPTLHRAFDNFLFTITEDFRVKVGRQFVETEDSPYRLSQFEGRKIFLPGKELHYPDRRRLKWHNARFLSDQP